MKDYFPESDFEKCKPPCKKSDMHPETLCKMNNGRHISGIPWDPTSAYRSPAWDRARGRSGTGAHTLGRAVDIAYTTLHELFLIIDAALKAGFKRIGIAKSFVHLDDSPNHAQEVIWLY